MPGNEKGSVTVDGTPSSSYQLVIRGGTVSFSLRVIIVRQKLEKSFWENSGILHAPMVCGNDRDITLPKRIKNGPKLQLQLSNGTWVVGSRIHHKGLSTDHTIMIKDNQEDIP
ncbi:hypothetical protein JTE90_028790 [Oedothorax gibbosus]|uniref:Uncharacterized protein n=1 Tax=Oedothorax gibbosus TaxID=931172 RepID=A0AAV6VZ43_9ARAC|nr:hypothetical protein JTE90_028790 [Oedothorax gibbosus]